MTELVRACLEEPLWPWPVAVAYSLSEKARSSALLSAVTILKEFPAIGGLTLEYTGTAAMLSVGDALSPPGPQSENNSYAMQRDALLRNAEEPLLKRLRHGELVAFGREEPNGPLKEISAISWTGGEVVYRRFCDLVPEGGRTQGDEYHSVSAKVEEAAWHYDLRVTRASMVDAFGLLDGLAPKGLLAVPPTKPRTSAPKWQFQRAEPQQELLFNFFTVAAHIMPGQEREVTRLDLHKRYVVWLAKQRSGGDAIKRTAFEKWLDRFLVGWRLGEGRRWQLSQ